VLRGSWSGVSELERPPAGSVVLLPTGRALCRTLELPAASTSQLETALRLQLDTLQLGSVPSHRTAAVVLPEVFATEGRLGFAIEWPLSEPTPAAPRDLPPDGEPCFAGDAACLVALLDAGLQGPLMLASEDRRALTFAMRAPKGVVVRCSRLDPTEWPGCAEAAVLESAVRAGADASLLRALLAQVREALPHVDDAGLGCTEADLGRLPDITGIGEEPAWWRAHATAVGAALAWFGQLRTLVSLRAQPKGERPSRVGEWLNRVAEPGLASQLMAAALITIAVGPPLVAGTRLLLLKWKVGDLSAREYANQAHRQRVALYAELQRRAWPMGKLLGDLACVTPEGVEWEDVNLSQDRNVSIQGLARPHDKMNGTEVLLKMERQMLDSRIFDRVQRKWEAADGKGTVKFQMSATVARATQRPNYSAEQDFGKKSLAERRFGPEKPDATEANAEPVAPLDPASLPSEPSLADASAESTESASTESASATSTEKPAPSGKRPSTVSSKPSSKPVKAERKSGSDAVAASETGGGEAAPADGGESKGARATRRSGASGGESGLARRSERNPGSSDSDFKPPEPLSDAAITAMTPEEVKTTLSKVSEARQRMPKDDPEQVRLKREFDKLMGRLRGGGS
jgi:Tfp pilus assembly protein PilN